MNYIDYISIDPNIRFGKPCVKTTRISVYDVLGWLANGMTHEQIISDFPELNEQAIRACLAFAAGHNFCHGAALDPWHFSLVLRPRPRWAGVAGRTPPGSE